MNTYYSSRSTRPAGFFSFGLLDGPSWITVSRTGRLTRTRPAHHLASVHKPDAPYSVRRGPRRRAQTWRALFSAPYALREAHGKGRALARLGWAGEMSGFGLSRFATAFMNNPGLGR
jgi:hypothetical protein